MTKLKSRRRHSASRYVRVLLAISNVADLLHERGIEISHQASNQFVPAPIFQ